MNKEDTYCGKCIKADVCGMEGVYDPATTYCNYRVESLPVGEWFITKAGYFKCSQCGYEPNFVIGGKDVPSTCNCILLKMWNMDAQRRKEIGGEKSRFLTKMFKHSSKGGLKCLKSFIIGVNVELKSYI